MQKNASLLAIVALHTAENEPSEVGQTRFRLSRRTGAVRGLNGDSGRVGRWTSIQRQCSPAPACPSEQLHTCVCGCVFLDLLLELREPNVYGLS